MKKETKKVIKKTVKNEQTKEVKETPVQKAAVKRDAIELKQIHSKLNRIIGQVGGIKRMLDAGRPSDDILIQLSAVSSIVNGVKLSFIKEVIATDIINKVKDGDAAAYDEIVELIKKYI